MTEFQRIKRLKDEYLILMRYSVKQNRWKSSHVDRLECNTNTRKNRRNSKISSKKDIT